MEKFSFIVDFPPKIFIFIEDFYTIAMFDYRRVNMPIVFPLFLSVYLRLL
jgi:hypothetical protein